MKKTTSKNTEHYVYGIHAVKELLSEHPGKVHRLFVQEPVHSALYPLVELAQKAQIPIVKKTKQELNLLCPGTHQGILADSDAFSYVSLNELLEKCNQSSSHGLLFALDGVTDPQNLGTLLRSVHTLGGNGLILPEDRSALITPSAIKAAAGAIEHIPVAKVSNLVRTLELLKEKDYWVYGASLSPSSNPPWKHDFKRKTVLVLGSEGKGLRRLIAECCDGHIYIPMTGNNTSLNVAVCSAILLYEALRQKH